MNKFFLFFLIFFMNSLFGIPEQAQKLDTVRMSRENLHLLIDQSQIFAEVQKVARRIELDYSNKDLCLVMILKGSLFLVTDLMKEIKNPLTLEVIQCSSYGSNGTQRGKLNIFGLERLNIKNKDVLVIDDIFDSGHTMATVISQLHQLQPKSIKSCVLLKKKVSRETAMHPDYVLFEVEDLFVVGYGLDYKERYRNLPGIYQLEFVP